MFISFSFLLISFSLIIFDVPFIPLHFSSHFHFISLSLSYHFPAFPFNFFLFPFIFLFFVWCPFTSPLVAVSFACVSSCFLFISFHLSVLCLISLHFSSHCHVICLRFLSFSLISLYFSFLFFIFLRYLCSFHFPFITVRFRSLTVKTADKAQR